MLTTTGVTLEILIRYLEGIDLFAEGSSHRL